MAESPAVDVPRKKTKVWCDGCYDLVHFGHANSLRQAKALGDHLVVGVHSDEEIARHKGPPVYTFDERCQLVAAIKWVDEVVGDAPYSTSLAVLDRHACDFCCHGEDVTCTADGVDTYADMKAARRYRQVARTSGVSTTGLLRRVLGHRQQRSPWTGAAGGFLLTGRRMGQFVGVGEGPRDGDVVVYVAGAFDLFHLGHLKFLERTRAMGDYLIVGVHPDALINQYRGANYPIMTLNERVLAVLACRHVSDVVIGAPWLVGKELIDTLGIDIVADGGEEEAFAGCELGDPFAYAKETKRFVRVQSGCDVTTEKVVERILANKAEYERRNDAKEQKEIDLFNELQREEAPH